MAPIVIVGPGEIGSTFATGFLRLGHTVSPVLRGQSLVARASELPPPTLVLVAVGEWELEPTLSALPELWRSQVVLVQNELVPSIWEAHQLSPSISIVWFEKRAGQAPRVVLPSVNYGPHADLLGGALGAIGLPCRKITDSATLILELAKKNLYILTLNLAGLRSQGTAAHLRTEHAELFSTLARELITLESTLMLRPLPEAELILGLEAAIDADPEHSCQGRTATRRLARALEQARARNLVLPTLEALGREFLDLR